MANGFATHPFFPLSLTCDENSNMRDAIYLLIPSYDDDDDPKPPTTRDVNMEEVMKRTREEEEEEEGKKEMEMKEGCSELRLVVKELSLLKLGDDAKASTMAFLAASNLMLAILDKIGPTMAVLRQDIHRNIERLEEFYLSEPSTYSSMMQVLKKEMDQGTARKPNSCSRAVLWLTRSLNFSVSLLERLVKDSELSLEQVVEEAYKSTLKPWHGWISSAAYKVATKLIPERKEFIALLMGQGKDYDMLKSDIKNLVLLLQPLIDEIQVLLRDFHLDKLKST